MGKMMRAIGLMSGTSMDGIDVALIETDGESRVERGPAQTVAYDPRFKASLREAIATAATMPDRKSRPGSLATVERDLTAHHANAVSVFLRQHDLKPGGIDVVGFHGQTVLHAPDRRVTVQLGDGPGLASAIGIDVVYDLRAADCAAGGQGAPLAPVYHRALAAQLPQRPLAVLNIGGVANVTWIGRHGELLSFDTGPGNALIDDWMQRRLGFPRDEGGTLAAKGRVHDDYVTQYLRHSYFGEPPPKSLDRNAFSPWMVHALSPEDGAATLTAFTTASIARAREHFPEQPQLWVVCGGGRLNKTLMAMIAGLVEAAVAPAEAVGMDGDAVEAEAWAYLAVRSLKGLPITFPGTTGVPRPLTGGVLAKTQ
jgi:anhydro-N-acetylmuramic acid kinase